MTTLRRFDRSRGTEKSKIASIECVTVWLTMQKKDGAGQVRNVICVARFV